MYTVPILIHYEFSIVLQLSPLTINRGRLGSANLIVIGKLYLTYTHLLLFGPIPVRRK